MLHGGEACDGVGLWAYLAGFLFSVAFRWRS